jgi:hypothetical protein
VDNRLFTKAGWGEIGNDHENLKENTKTAAIQLSDLTALVPGSPVWASRVIDENNDEIDSRTGEPINHPAPNLLTGNPFNKDDEPSVGRGDDACRDDNTICRYTISDRAPHLKALHYGIPGFKSFSQFHDSQMFDKETNKEAGAAYKFFTIFPFIPANYYGAIGTILDAKNWTENSSQNDNNSNPIFSYDK